MPKIFKKILCPVAFDENSGGAIDFARQLADSHLSTLYLLHVLSVPTVETVVLEPHPILNEGIAARELEKLAKHHLPVDLQREVVLRSGDPASLIVKVAEELQADLIVMPTHGRQGIMQMMLGSVAERIVREAKPPVLTMKPSRHSSAAGISRSVSISVRTKDA